jgi:hypothetical protein
VMPKHHILSDYFADQGHYFQAFQALQTAYIRLLRNPFYVPDEHDSRRAKVNASLEINSPNFIREVERIGNAWYPGLSTI